MVQQLNHATTYASSACQHHAEIPQSHTFAVLIVLITLTTTTHNLLTFKDEPLESLWGGGEAGEVQKKYSRKEKLNEKKFMHAN